MPNSTVPGMPSVTTPTGSELVYVVQGGQDRKATFTQVLSLARTLLAANQNYYVSTTGSDTTGDGTIGNPWATLQFATNFVAHHIDLGGFDVHIILVAGTAGSPTVYAGLSDLFTWTGHGNVYIETSDGDPTHTKISAVGLPIFIQESTQVSFGGMWIESTGGASGHYILAATNNCQIFLGTTNCPNIKLGTSGDNFSQIFLNDHASLEISSTTIIELAPQASGCQGFVSTSGAGYANLDGTYTITGNPAWGNAFIFATDGSHIDVNIAVGTNATGASTGIRWIGDANAVIHSVTQPLSLLPGDTDGLAINAQSNAGLTSNFGQITFIQIDKGTIGSGTVTFDVSMAARQKLTLSGSASIAFANWIGGFSELRIQLINGAAGVGWPTVTWMKGDGTSSSTFGSMGVTLSSGTNWVEVWSSDSGTTVYGSAM